MHAYVIQPWHGRSLCSSNFSRPASYLAGNYIQLAEREARCQVSSAKYSCGVSWRILANSFTDLARVCAASRAVHTEDEVRVRFRFGNNLHGDILLL